MRWPVTPYYSWARATQGPCRPSCFCCLTIRKCLWKTKLLHCISHCMTFKILNAIYHDTLVSSQDERLANLVGIHETSCQFYINAKSWDLCITPMKFSMLCALQPFKYLHLNSVLSKNVLKVEIEALGQITCLCIKDILN